MTNKNPSIYSPEFIPFYRDVQKKYNLTTMETLVYGFIRFYIKTVKADRFYFDNDGIASIVGFKNSQNASEAVNKLEKMGFIGCHYEIKANGGKVRFIEWKTAHPKATRLSPTTESDSVLQLSPTKSYDLVHSINKNKININSSNIKLDTSNTSTSQKKAPPTNRLSRMPKCKNCGHCAHCSLTPLTEQELYDLAIELDFNLSDVETKHREIVEMLEDGSFQKRYPKHKTVWFTLRTWLRMSAERGYIKPMTDIERMFLLSDSPETKKQLKEIHEKLVRGEIKL